MCFFLKCLLLQDSHSCVCLSCSGFSGCKRGESQRADGVELQVSAGAAPGAGHLSLQRPGLPLRTVRGHGDRDEPGHRGFR